MSWENGLRDSEQVEVLASHDYLAGQAMGMLGESLDLQLVVVEEPYCLPQLAKDYQVGGHDSEQFEALGSQME